MFQDHKFFIKETGRFAPSVFPQWEEGLQQTTAKPAAVPAGLATAMILSFVKDHRIHAQHVLDYPEFAGQIRSNSSPQTVLEQLIDLSRRKRSYRKDLEPYVTGYLGIGTTPKTPIATFFIHDQMTIKKELSPLTISVTHYRSYQEMSKDSVSCTIYRECEWYRAVPALTRKKEWQPDFRKNAFFCTSTIVLPMATTWRKNRRRSSKKSSRN